MKIKFLGHSAFLITGAGKKIITDPYKSGAFGSLNYKPIKESADIVTISHEHDDHNYLGEIKGNPKIIRGEGEREINGVKIKGVATYHDPVKGKERGKNTIFLLEVEGMRLAHLGDLGESLNEEVLREIGEVDILLLPVGGYFTISATEATKIMTELKPKITIPMHYKTSACDFPISPVDDFLGGKKNCRFLEKSEVEIKKEDLSAFGGDEVWVLKPERV
ncbi:MAG: MBL fold metallo-hydrolase [candidate division WOR-3 bacterium]